MNFVKHFHSISKQVELKPYAELCNMHILYFVKIRCFFVFLGFKCDCSSILYLVFRVNFHFALGVRQDSKGLLGRKVQLDSLGIEDSLDNQVLQVPLDRLALLVIKDFRELMVLLETLARQEELELQDHQVDG